MNLVESFYQEFKEIPVQIYQVDQMLMLGHLTEDEAQELVFNLNMDMYRGSKLPDVEKLQAAIEHWKECDTHG